MAVNIGPKIGIDGEAEYRKQLQNLVQESKTLQAEMDALTSSFDENTSAEEQATKKSEVLQKQIETQKDRVEKLADMVERSTEATGEDSDETLKWKEALYGAQKGLNNLEKQTDASTEEVEEIGNEMEKSGDKASVFADVLKANLLSDAIKKGFENLANSAVQLGKAFVNNYTEQVEWADKLGENVAKTGMSADALQEYMFMADLVDTSVETITGSMTKLTMNMNKARTGSGDAADAFHLLGVEVTNGDGSLRESSVVFNEVIDKLALLEDGTNRDAITMQIFGKSAKELNPLIEAGSETLEEYRNQAYEMGYVLEDDALTSLMNVSDNFALLQNAVDATKRQLAGAFSPFVEDITDEVLPTVSNLTSAFAGLLQGNVSMSEFVDLILEKANELVDGLKENLPEILLQGQEMIKTLTDGINSLLPELVPMALDIVMMLVNSIVDNLPSIIETGTIVLLSLIQGIGNQLPSLIPMVIKCILTIVDTLTQPDNIGMVVNAAIAIMEGLIRGILSAIPTLIERVPDIIVQFVGAILSNLPKLLESGIRMLGEVAAGIVKAIPKVAQSIGSVVAKIKETLFGNGGEKFKNWGKDMIDGIASGIRNAIGKIADAAKSVANTISSWLHFSRPDVGPLRQYETWMPDMVDGMIKGIKNSSARLDSAMYDLTSGMYDAGSGQFGSLRGGRVTNMGGVTINVNAAAGQSESAIADAVMEKMQRIYDGKVATWA